MNSVKKNWRTTAAGVLTIVGVLVMVLRPLLDGDPATNPDFGAAYTQFMLGLGLITAGDGANIPG